MLLTVQFIRRNIDCLRAECATGIFLVGVGQFGVGSVQRVALCWVCVCVCLCVEDFGLFGGVFCGADGFVLCVLL